MENRKVVVDTSVFIEFLRAKDKTQTTLYQIPDSTNICISSVTLYELLMGATDESKAKDVSALTNDLIILSFSESIAKEASLIYHKLRKQNKMIEFRDIFIAATCIINGMPIVTLNKKHFERIKDLKIK